MRIGPTEAGCQPARINKSKTKMNFLLVSFTQGMDGLLGVAGMIINDYWLVGQGHPSEKYEFVSWDD